MDKADFLNRPELSCNDVSFPVPEDFGSFVVFGHITTMGCGLPNNEAAFLAIGPDTMQVKSPLDFGLWHGQGTSGLGLDVSSSESRVEIYIR